MQSKQKRCQNYALWCIRVIYNLDICRFVVRWFDRFSGGNSGVQHINSKMKSKTKCSEKLIARGIWRCTNYLSRTSGRLLRFIGECIELFERQTPLQQGLSQVYFDARKQEGMGCIHKPFSPNLGQLWSEVSSWSCYWWWKKSVLLWTWEKSTKQSFGAQRWKPAWNRKKKSISEESTVHDHLQLKRGRTSKTTWS